MTYIFIWTIATTTNRIVTMKSVSLCVFLLKKKGKIERKKKATKSETQPVHLC